MKVLFHFISFFLVSLFLTGCIKETYDMRTLSKEESYNPEMAFPTVSGTVTINDLNLGINVRINNLQVIDTVDNFLNLDGSYDDSPVRPENFDLIYLDVEVNNEFPLNVSMQMSLFDTRTGRIKGTVDATDILPAAPVDNYGRVTRAIPAKTTIKFTKEFLSSIPSADKVVFLFTFNTSDEGNKYVTIVSPYKIWFSAALIFKPNLDL